MATAFAYRSRDATLSDSDSDDSDKECLNWKRVTKNEGEDLERIPMIPPVVESSPLPTSNPSSLKRKRNTIWCEVLEDQIMSETLNHCGIKNKPKGYGERGEESYDYTLGRKARDEASDDEMSDASQTSSLNSRKRFKDDKFVEIDSAGAEAARKIIKVLAEQKQYLIYRIVKYLGIEKAMKFLKMTEDIEDEGGIMIKNQQRRRTPGGVYLHLVRTDKSIEKDIMDKIFEGELNSFEMKKKYKEMKKKKKKKNSNSHNHHNRRKYHMEYQPSTPENQNEHKKDSEPGHMEEDNVMNECPNLDVNERTSDLEEGEVE